MSVRSHVHPAKVAIDAEMRVLNRPVISKQLYARFERRWSLRAIEYHLDALRKIGIVEVVLGRELHFSLVDSEDGTNGLTRERCR